MHQRDSTARLIRGLRSTERENAARAVAFAREHLHALKRRSGESYAQHGEEVAATLRELHSGVSLLSVAVLHDLPVHPGGEALLSASPLTDDECQLVAQMHGLRRLHIDADSHDLDAAIDAFTTDARLLPLRMAHRLNDVRHLERFSPPLRRQIARETLHMYAAIAGRLGMHAWRHEMEDRCFAVLHPSIVRDLQKKFTACGAADRACLEHGQRYLRRKLREQGIDGTVDGRIKSLYSTYKKMAVKRRPFHELTDRLALRVILENVDDCYRALGVVHACLHPIPGKLKDYIGAPKENGYRSIHTVVYPLPGVTEQPVEIQIRTAAMHRECEFGVANHGEYKNALYETRSGMAHVELFRNLQSLREESHSPKQFEHALLTYFDGDHLAVFDPQNTLYHLKKPVTALDFTCHAYGRRVKYLKSVRVNGRERPLDTALSNGDTVEARFGKGVAVRKEWLRACSHRGCRGMLRGILRSA